MENFTEIGSSGLLHYSGYIQDDFLREWRGKEAYKRADEMRRNSPIVGALLMAIEQAVRKVTWTWTSETAEDDPRLEILNACWAQMEGSWNDHVIEALNMLPFGYALFEIVYQRVGNWVVWKKLAPRGQDTVYRWQMDPTGQILGVDQQAAPTYALVNIPIGKLIHYRTRAERNNPEGRSILRAAWVPYYYVKNIQQIEAIGIERDLAGLPVITLPDKANTDTSDPNSDASRAAKIVRNIRQDEQAGVVIPNGWNLELLSTGGSRQFDTDKIVNRYNSQILMTALAQFLMLGQEGVGSLALSKDQTDLFTMSVNAVADTLAETINHQALPRLMRLNGYTADGLALTHSPAGDTDVAGLADVFQKVGDKLTWTPADEIMLREVLRWRPATEEELIDERERRMEEQRSLMEGLGGLGEEKPAPDRRMPAEDEDEEDDLGATLLAAGRPAEWARKRYERRWARSLSAFFADQKARLLKHARKSRHA